MRDLMIDLETMSTSSNAAIVSVGAVLFDTEDGVLGDTMSLSVSLQSSIDLGLAVDGATVAWWMRQENEARKAIFGEPRLTIKTALAVLANYIESSPMGSDVKVWGNGAAFDAVVLRNAYDRSGILCPWNFRNERCYRTVKVMFPMVGKPGHADRVKHVALSDAIDQAEHLIAIYRHIRHQTSK
jgi:exodeoxyribonuclease VIII